VSLHAVADAHGSAYRVGMNSVSFLHHRSESATARVEGRTPLANDPLAITKKALERWENEGGRIPELAVGSHGAGLVPRRSG